MGKLGMLFGGLLMAGSAAALDGSAINSGDVAWVAASAALVMLMTPALGFFYGGLVRRKNLLSVLAQSLAIFAVASVAWALWGFSIAFGPNGGFFGSLDWLGLNGVGTASYAAYAATIPLLLFFFFQLKFAAITPALIIGAFAERIRFSTLLLFTLLWVTLVYSPVAHWVWGQGGWLREMGALDFAGGTVVHIAAGFSALAAAIIIGKRKDFGKPFHPNNVPFVILGAALLWFGWFGFNGGSALAANGVAVIALVTTNLAAAAAAITWMATDWLARGKPSATGIAIGAVCGLVAITPAAGFVSPLAAIIIGGVAGVLCNAVANWRASRLAFDDSLDVFACHGVGGVWGALATGIFASTAINPAGANGLLYGNPGQLMVQIIAVVAVAAFSFAGSLALLKAVSLFKPLRVNAEAEETGLDEATHGEAAYR
ncbi:MAG: ammonium transporter [Candidatus Micrarchaeota archaeon]